MKVLVTHQKGGVGKTTVSVALAHLFTKQGYSCAIVDYDMQGSIIQFKNLYAQLGISVYHKLSIKEIDQLNYDFIVIDTPPYLFENIEQITKIVDLVVIPLRPNILDITAVEETLNIINDNNLISKTVLLFNQVMHYKGKDIKNEEARKEINKTGFYVLKNQLDLSVQFERIVEGEYEAKSQEQIEIVFTEILEFLNR